LGPDSLLYNGLCNDAAIAAIPPLSLRWYIVAMAFFCLQHMLCGCRFEIDTPGIHVLNRSVFAACVFLCAGPSHIPQSSGLPPFSIRHLMQKKFNFKPFCADYNIVALCKQFARYLYYNFGSQLQRVLPQNKAGLMLP